jgi:hypothetical protein
VIDAVDDQFAKQATGDTVEVDVIGVSMGGLVARYAARRRTSTRRDSGSPSKLLPSAAPLRHELVGSTFDRHHRQAS